MELGEYARDQGFWLPNPVSIQWEYSRLRFGIEVVCRNFKKWRYLVRDIQAL